MSTITPTRPKASPASSAAPPLEDVYRLDIEEFERAVHFLKAERVRVNRRVDRRAKPYGPPPRSGQREAPAQARSITSRWLVRPGKQTASGASNIRTAPGPRSRPGRSESAYGDRHPGPADVAIAIEISNSTLVKDRGEKLVNYAKGRIGIYWIVNLIDRQVEVYTLRRRGGYGKPRIFKSGQSVPVVINGNEVGLIVVDEILPRIVPSADSNGA